MHTPLICLLIALRFYRIYSCCLGQISSLSLPYLCCNGSLMVKYCHHKTKQHEHAMSLRCSQLTPSYPSVQLQEPSTTLQVPLFWQVHCPAHPRPKVPSEHSVQQIAQKLPLITLLCLQKYAVQVQSNITLYNTSSPLSSTKVCFWSPFLLSYKANCFPCITLLMRLHGLIKHNYINMQQPRKDPK